MQPSERAFDHPAKDSHAAAVLGVSLGENGFDPASAKLLSMRFGIIAAVPLNTIWFLSRSSRLPTYWRDAVDQGEQFFDVVYICCGQDDCQWNALGIGNHVMFAARLGSISRIRPSFWPSSESSHRGTVYNGSRPVNLEQLSNVVF